MKSSSALVSALLLLCGAAPALAETCPKDEDIEPCTCFQSMSSRREIHITCDAEQRPELDMLDFKALFKKLQGKKIEEFWLYDIPLKRVPSDLFKGLRVRRIFFHHCELEGLATTDEDLPFQGLEHTLEELNIDECFEGSNELRHLKLNHLKRLQAVFIIDNNVPEIKNDWFQDGPSNLEEISFIRCHVKKIGDKAFAALPNLEFLTLSDNAFEDVKRSMFPKPASRLESLLMDTNRIPSLPEDIFTDMPALIDLDLMNNDLRRLPRATWSPVWSQLQQLYLQNNRLECDSHMDWIFDLVRPTSLIASCVSPRDRKGKHLDELIDDHRKEH